MKYMTHKPSGWVVPLMHFVNMSSMCIDITMCILKPHVK